MKKRYHEGIMYPGNKEELLSLLGNIKRDKEAKAIILPHQEMKRSASLLAEGLSYTKGKERVIIISPLHCGRMEGEDSFFFEGELLPESNMFHLGAKVEEAYAEEEGGAEMTASLIEHALPSLSWALVYADIRNAKESKTFAAFLEKHDSPSTLFIISTNLSPKCSDNEMVQWRESAKSALEDGSEILDKVNHHKIHYCGAGITDAFERLYGGGWKWIMDREEDSTTAHSLLVKEERK